MQIITLLALCQLCYITLSAVKKKRLDVEVSPPASAIHHHGVFGKWLAIACKCSIQYVMLAPR